jgi:hypothetical protein
MRTGGTRSLERFPSPRPQNAVLGDQRPVEIAGEGGDVPREGRRKLERYGSLPPVDVTT